MFVKSLSFVVDRMLTPTSKKPRAMNCRAVNYLCEHYAFMERPKRRSRTPEEFQKETDEESWNFLMEQLLTKKRYGLKLGCTEEEWLKENRLRVQEG